MAVRGICGPRIDTGYLSNPPDDRSPMAVALSWATRITTISASMVLPGLAGYWLDQKLHTRVLFTLGGFAFGMIVGVWQLVRLTRSDERNSQRPNGGRSGEGEGRA